MYVCAWAFVCVRFMCSCAIIFFPLGKHTVSRSIASRRSEAELEEADRVDETRYRDRR